MATMASGRVVRGIFTVKTAVTSKTFIYMRVFDLFDSSLLMAAFRFFVVVVDNHGIISPSSLVPRGGG